MFEELLVDIDQFRFTQSFSTVFSHPKCVLVREKQKWNIVFRDNIHEELSGFPNQQVAEQEAKDILAQNNVPSKEIETPFKKQYSGSWRATNSLYPIQRSPLRFDKFKFQGKTQWTFDRLDKEYVNQYNIKNDVYSALADTRKQSLISVRTFVAQYLLELYDYINKREPGRFEKEFMSLSKHQKFYQDYHRDHLWWMLFLKPNKDILTILK